MNENAVEYAVVTTSEDGLKEACESLILDLDDVYVISSLSDLHMAKRASTHARLVAVKAYDWHQTNVKQRDIDEVNDAI